jgi:hypothetical protein
MRAGLAQGALVSPDLFSVYVNDMPAPFHHLGLARCATDTTIIPTSRKPALLVSYLESYLSDLERWLNEWIFAIKVSKSNAMFFTGRSIPRPRRIQLFGELIHWVDKIRYLGGGGGEP